MFASHLILPVDDLADLPAVFSFSLEETDNLIS